MPQAGKADLHQRISYLTLLLGGFSALATIFLVTGNLATRDAIAERQKENLLASLNQVIPKQYYENNLLDLPLQIKAQTGSYRTIYRGTKNKQITTLAWQITGQGYSGEIRMIMGINASADILGVRVLSHTETPGLGDLIEIKKDKWITIFNGLSLTNPAIEKWQVKKDGGVFDAFSGATITPRAVIKAIKQGLVFFNENRLLLLSPETIEEKTEEKTEIPSINSTQPSIIKPQPCNQQVTNDEP